MGPHPLRNRFRVAAVTGTDGKTTTTTLIEAMARAAGEHTLRITTLGAYLDGERIGEPARPQGFDHALRAGLDHGATFLALEVTSHALSDGFARRFPPDVAVLTSFSRDHLDHHGSPEHYLASKAQLFLSLRPSGTAILPLEVPASELILELLEGRTDLTIRRTSVTGDPRADLYASSVSLGRGGLTVRVGGSARAARIETFMVPLRSTVHASNVLGALLAAEAMGLPVEAMARALASFPGIEGRMQVALERPLVLVDFAHTPNALEGTLRSARSLANDEGGRLFVVFGCGGDRDKGKRPEMGRIAAALADEVIVTSDNPRGERAEDIAAAIESGIESGIASGITSGAARVRRELDREAAIHLAIREADERDVVVLAGKGHEVTQDREGQLRACSDLEIAQRVQR